jgi:hypothetical protein
MTVDDYIEDIKNQFKTKKYASIFLDDASTAANVKKMIWKKTRWIGWRFSLLDNEVMVWKE